MATAILNEIFQLDIVRTRDENVLNELDIVYDVGGGEFDHHGIDKVYREDGIPYAACGLIWNRFGKDVIYYKDPTLREDEIDAAFQHIDKVLIEGIDALDNGIRAVFGEIPIMNISSIIGGFNPFWHSDKDENEAFFEAVDVASAVLNNTIAQRISILRSRETVVKAYENRPVPEILFLDMYCPYGEALQDIDEKGEVVFVVYARNDSYALQTIRGKGGVEKKRLPEAWAGKRDEELAAVTGVQDAVFCHFGRFLAIAKSYEGIMKLAQLAIAERERAERWFFRLIRRVFSGR